MYIIKKKLKESGLFVLDTGEMLIRASARVPVGGVLADDPLCSGDQRRCGLMPTCEVGTELKVDGHIMQPGESFRRGPTVCDFTEVTVVGDRVRLIPGVGGHWTLYGRGERIVGRARPSDALPASAKGCGTDDDCTVTNLSGGCCIGCGWQPISKAELAAREELCSRKDVDCPNRTCGPADRETSVCVEGQCAFAPLESP